MLQQRAIWLVNGGRLCRDTGREKLLEQRAKATGKIVWCDQKKLTWTAEQPKIKELSSFDREPIETYILMSKYFFNTWFERFVVQNKIHKKSEKKKR